MKIFGSFTTIFILFLAMAAMGLFSTITGIEMLNWIFGTGILIVINFFVLLYFSIKKK